MVTRFLRYMEAGKQEAIPRKSDSVCWLAHFSPQLAGSSFFHSNEIYRKCLYMNHIMALKRNMVWRHCLLEYIGKMCCQHIYNFSTSDTLTGISASFWCLKLIDSYNLQHPGCRQSSDRRKQISLESFHQQFFLFSRFQAAFHNVLQTVLGPKTTVMVYKHYTALHWHFWMEVTFDCCDLAVSCDAPVQNESLMTSVFDR